MGYKQLLQFICLIFICSCAKNATPKMSYGVSSHQQALRYWLVEGAYDCKSAHEDRRIQARIERDRDILKEKTHGEIELINTQKQLREMISTTDRRPIVIFYSGHGICEPTSSSDYASCSASGKSKLCLKDGPIEVDLLVSLLDSPISYAVLILNSCFSAHLDVRKANIPLSVLSASTRRISTEGTGLPLSSFLSQDLQSADGNGDGWIDDYELLQFYYRIQNESANSTLKQGDVAPRLRRQAFSALPVFRVKSFSGTDSELLQQQLVDWGIDAAAAQNVINRESDFRNGKVPVSPYVYWINRKVKTSEILRLSALANNIRASEGFLVKQNGNVAQVILLKEQIIMGEFDSTQLDEVKKNISQGFWTQEWDVKSHEENQEKRSGIRFYGKVSTPPSLMDGSVLSESGLKSRVCDLSFGQCFVYVDERNRK
jgi:hypothetical protein